MEFPGVIKKKPWKFHGCNTIVLNFQGEDFDLSGISKGKVRNLKFPEVFSKRKERL